MAQELAPTLPAYLDNEKQQTFVWCKYCDKWHQHGAAEGHRGAHCTEESPYSATGYFIKIVGPWSKAIARGQGRVMEREVQDALVEQLKSNGVPCECYKRCTVGVADVVTSSAVYEVKRDWKYALEAIGQVLAYSKALGGGREPVLVFPWIPQEHPMFDILRDLGIRIMTVPIMLQGNREAVSRRLRPLGFSKWLLDQTGRLDPVGVLAREIVKDKSWPLAGNHLAEFQNYLDSCSAHDYIREALLSAWEEWCDDSDIETGENEGEAD